MLTLWQGTGSEVRGRKSWGSLRPSRGHDVLVVEKSLDAEMLVLLSGSVAR